MFQGMAQNAPEFVLVSNLGIAESVLPTQHFKQLSDALCAVAA